MSRAASCVSVQVREKERTLFCHLPSWDIWMSPVIKATFVSEHTQILCKCACHPHWHIRTMVFWHLCQSDVIFTYIHNFPIHQVCDRGNVLVCVPTQAKQISVTPPHCSFLCSNGNKSLTNNCYSSRFRAAHQTSGYSVTCVCRWELHSQWSCWPCSEHRPSSSCHSHRWLGGSTFEKPHWWLWKCTSIPLIPRSVITC